MKKKCYTLIISKHFPKSHPRAGEPTEFLQKIEDYDKVHTIRANYDFWKKRFEKIVKGEAYLSIRVWSGVPYKSKQVEIYRF